MTSTLYTPTLVVTRYPRRRPNMARRVRSMESEAIHNVVSALIGVPLIWVTGYLMLTDQGLIALAPAVSLGGLILQRFVSWFGVPYVDRSDDW